MREPISLDHIPPEHHQGVGLVANAWSYLEGVVERIIWRLARLEDNHGAAITTHMGIKNRLDTACALAELEFPDVPQTKRLFELHGYILGDQMYGKRNEIVHSRVFHFADASGGQTLRSITKARKRVSKTIVQIIPTEYTEVAKRFLDTATELRIMLAAYIVVIEAKKAATEASKQKC